MYTIRRYFVFILCLCMSSYSLPVFAYALDNDEHVSNKVELSDEAMDDIHGAGNIDATMLDYKVGGTPAQAIVVNRSGMNASYVMELLDYDSNVLEVLAEGTLGTGTGTSPVALKLVTGTPTVLGAQNRIIRIRMQTTTGHVSVDTSIALSSIDSDIDGISDWNEKKHGLNPYSDVDAQLDNDGDGLSNIDEINIHFTNPNNPDTDGDGIRDDKEIFYDLNPLNAVDATLDADGDYVTNIDEINGGTDPNIANLGLVKDTDVDGINDTIELALGTDPNDPADHTVGLDTPTDKSLAHLLNRTTFGLTPELLSDVAAAGSKDLWLDQQLLGVPFESDNIQPLRERSYVRNNEVETLGSIRPVHSDKQLQARMGLFWDNHFSTSITETRWDSELHEEDRFFSNAFGNFRTLLGISAKGHAMLEYLDLLKSTKQGANENYAREVMELHTLGTTVTDGDYTGNDIAELARIFTGWSVSLDTLETSRYKSLRGNPSVLYDSLYYKFKFRPERHDDTPKVFLNTTFPIPTATGTGVGVKEGDDALDMLAAHPSTAKFICLKLARHFISDNPSSGTLTECANVFTTNQNAVDQMGKVVRYLVTSKDFKFFRNQQGKFKDHQEYIFSLARIANWSAVGYVPTTGGVIARGVIGDIAERMDQRQFAKEEPTGWAEDVAGGWLSANSALHRFREGNLMSLNGQTRLAAEFKDKGITSSKDVLANLFLMMLGGNYTNEHMVMGYGFLHPKNATFDLNTTPVYTADARIRLLISRLAQMPEFSAH